MKQFYYTSVPANFKTITFVHPVRKVAIVSSKSSAMRIAGDNTYFYIPANFPVYLDFQSANSGKSVVSLEFKSFSAENPSDIYVSVAEYGSDGDNDWFK